MKKSIYLLVLVLFAGFHSAFGQDTRHYVGISSGITMPWENGIYIDYDQYVIWPDSKINPTFSMFYEYQLSSYFKLGCHVDFEKTKVEVTYPFDENIKSKRFALGVHWIGQYPNNRLHAELGGFSNFAYASSDAWDSNLKGVEYGIIVGPAFSIKKFKIALHFQPTFSYFFSKDLPENILLLYPRVMCKLHYTI